MTPSTIGLRDVPGETVPPERPSLFAEVAVHSAMPHRQLFSYSVPTHLHVAPGDGVYVPFGRLVLQGVVVEVHNTPVFSEPEKIRPVTGLIAERMLDAERVALASWMADEYISPIFDGIAVMLPPGFERKPETIIHRLVDPEEVAGIDLTARQRELLAALSKDEVELQALRARLKFTHAEPILAQLEQNGLIVREYRLARPSVSPKHEVLARLVVQRSDAQAMIDAAEPAKRSRRADLLRRLLHVHELPATEALRVAGSRANLDRLIHAGAARYGGNRLAIKAAMPPADMADEIRRLTTTSRALRACAALLTVDLDMERTTAELREAGIDAATVRWLAQIGVLTLTEQPVGRDPLKDLSVSPRPPARLLRAQQQAADAIGAALRRNEHKAFLLHGVTGSGKTEVYLQALDECLAGGRRAIILVPELALTPQTVRRFRERFERVAVLHSGLADGELFDQWYGIARGRYDVVIGARSAVFAPQPDLGLIIVDEEHEWSYKQHDRHPRYHARDVALELARLKGAVVVLGSATPDVESYARAERGDYTLLTLPERIRPVAGPDGTAVPQASAAMPETTVIDLRAELRDGNRSIFSIELQDALKTVLSRGEQAILFLNRRGLAGHVQCRDCGHVPQCGGCAVALTYHQQYDRLLCHQCNRRIKLPSVCPQCGSPRVRLMGTGVEKVEAEAHRLIPHARLLRWDRDTTRGRRTHERILAACRAGDVDILIGTQMLAKGLDLPSVTLVGVVNADAGLHIPDFRTGERTFQLLTQVAGRAGRGLRPGRAIIQTYSPEHYAIEAAARYDYEAFFATELAGRKSIGYPPFARLVRVTVSHVNPKGAREEALRVHRALSHRRAEIGSDVEVLPPAPAYVPRVRGRWRWQILLRGRDPGAVVRGFVLPDHCSVDVDPVGA